MTTDVQPSSPPNPPPEKKPNVFQRIAGVLFAPAETFQDIARRPDVLGPLLFILVVGYLSTAVLMPKLDLSTMLTQQAEKMRERDSNMSDEQIAQMERITAAGAKVMFWVFPVLFVLWYVIVAGALLLAFKLMDGEGTFKQAFSVTLYSWMPMVLLGILSTIIALARGSFDPVMAATIVKSNPAFLADMKEQPVLFALLSSLDLFTIWMLALLIVGCAAMAKTSKTKAAAIVISLWIALTVAKLGMAALNS
ncbi:MAG TPA: Yip1 family protein [Thermoanaerobaculia bacterium]|nr:Yip1 family protein [Thermoanaerobaculia bacterium]